MTHQFQTVHGSKLPRPNEQSPLTFAWREEETTDVGKVFDLNFAYRPDDHAARDEVRFTLSAAGIPFMEYHDWDDEGYSWLRSVLPRKVFPDGEIGEKAARLMVNTLDDLVQNYPKFSLAQMTRGDAPQPSLAPETSFYFLRYKTETEREMIEGFGASENLANMPGFHTNPNHQTRAEEMGFAGYLVLGVSGKGRNHDGITAKVNELKSTLAGMVISDRMQ